MRALPSPPASLPIEDYAAPTSPRSCAGVARPGVKKLRDFVISNLGGKSLGIVRSCAVRHAGKLSDHHEGRAWDWGLMASDPEDRARAQVFLDWLFSPDEAGNPDANARRIGLTYIIWDRKIWSTRGRQWRDYTGYSPHTDHIHMSLGWPGARGQTSFYDWLEGGEPPEPVAPPAEPRKKLVWVEPIAMAAGLFVGYLLLDWMLDL